MLCSQSGCRSWRYTSRTRPRASRFGTIHIFPTSRPASSPAWVRLATSWPCRRRCDTSPGPRDRHPTPSTDDDTCKLHRGAFPSMDIRKIKKLIELLEESGIAEIEIKEGEEALRISRMSSGTAVAHVPSVASLPLAAPLPVPQAAAPAAAAPVAK